MTLSAEDMDLIFRAARTQNGWQAKPVSDEQLRQLYDLMKWAPTTMNTSPARILFLRSREAKERLKPALNPGNVDKTMAAPVTAIIGCLLYTSDAADDLLCVDLGGRRII